jgi:hypothetical protein
LNFPGVDGKSSSSNDEGIFGGKMFLIGEEEERGKKEKGRKELVIEMQMQV